MTLARKSFDVIYQPCMVRRTMVTEGGDTTHPSSSETKVKGDVWMTNIQFQLYSQCRRSMVERGLIFIYIHVLHILYYKYCSSPLINLQQSLFYLPNSCKASLINFSKLPDSIDSELSSVDKLDLDVTLKIIIIGCSETGGVMEGGGGV